jgi:site-specific DNA recombinase
VLIGWLALGDPHRRCWPLDGRRRAQSGHIYKLLSNPIYVGRIAHKGQIYEGHHPPIVTQDLWDEVQQSLSDHLGAARTNMRLMLCALRAAQPSA